MGAFKRCNNLFVHVLWEKSRILGKILVSRVGIGDGLSFRPVGDALLRYSCGNVVDLFAEELQLVSAVRNEGLPFLADVTLPLWKTKRRSTSQRRPTPEARACGSPVYLELLAVSFLFSGSFGGTIWVLLTVPWTSSAPFGPLSLERCPLCTWGCIFRRQNGRCQNTSGDCFIHEAAPWSSRFQPSPHPPSCTMFVCDTCLWTLPL